MCILSYFKYVHTYFNSWYWVSFKDDSLLRERPIIYLWLERLALEERIFRDKEKKKELNDPLGEIFKKFGDKE